MAKRGRIISGVDVNRMRSELETWHNPSEMVAKVNATVERLGDVAFFNAPDLTFLREAWIAGKFGKSRGAERVRLIPDHFPDFVISIDGREEEFEAAEVDAPDRRRGLEYAGQEGGIVHDPVEQWVERARRAPEWIARVCRQKAEKRYGYKAHLVVYLNMGEYDIRHKEVVGTFPEATAPAHAAFASVWVLWKDEAYLASPRPA